MSTIACARHNTTEKCLQFIRRGHLQRFRIPSLYAQCGLFANFFLDTKMSSGEIAKLKSAKNNVIYNEVDESVWPCMLLHLTCKANRF